MPSSQEGEGRLGERLPLPAGGSLTGMSAQRPLAFAVTAPDLHQ